MSAPETGPRESPSPEALLAAQVEALLALAATLLGIEPTVEALIAWLQAQAEVLRTLQPLILSEIGFLNSLLCVEPAISALVDWLQALQAPPGEPPPGANGNRAEADHG